VFFDWHPDGLKCQMSIPEMDGLAWHEQSEEAELDDGMPADDGMRAAVGL
jgi:hypothetical protein